MYSNSSVESVGSSTVEKENVVEEETEGENNDIEDYRSRRLTREEILQEVKEKSWVFLYEHPEYRNDREIVIEAVKKNGISLKYASEELRNNREFVLEIVKQNGRSLQFSNEEFRNDREIVLEAIKHGWNVRFSSEELRNDKDLIFQSIIHNPGTCDVSFVNESVLETSSVLRALKKFKGDIEKVYEEYSMNRKIKYDGFFEKVFDIKLKEKGYRSCSQSFSSKERIGDEKSGMNKLRSLMKGVSFPQLEILRFLGRGSYGGTYLCRIRGVEIGYQNGKVDFIIEFSNKLLSTDERVSRLLRRSGNYSHLDHIDTLMPSIYSNAELGGGLFVAKFSNPGMSRNKMEEVIKRDSLYLPYHKNVVSILSHRSDVWIDLRKFPDYEEYWRGITTHLGNKRIAVGMILMKYHRLSLEILGKDYFGSHDSLEKHYYSISRKILEGAHHLHKNCVVHRDLHPGNIFVYPAEGSSVYFKEHGAPDYTAPEILNFDPMRELYFNYEKSDIYSVGVLLKWISGNKPLSENLIEKLLKKSLIERVGFEEAIQEVLELQETEKRTREGFFTRLLIDA